VPAECAIRAGPRRESRANHGCAATGIDVTA
jgi:hypothetical protein